MNPRQRAVGEFQGHECLGRERTGQVAGLLGREAKARIVVLVSQHDDDTFTSFAELSKTAANQLASNLDGLDSPAERPSGPMKRRLQTLAPFPRSFDRKEYDR